MRRRESGKSKPSAPRLRTFALSRFLTRPPALLICLLILTGCRTLPPLAPADLSQPGWAIHEGQAIWKSDRDAPEIAGDLIYAAHPDGRGFLQFTKGPFPLVTAQLDGRRWSIEFPEHRSFSGAGTPPARLGWLRLMRWLRGDTPGQGWGLERDDDNWRLRHQRSGEAIEGFLNPATSG